MDYELIRTLLQAISSLAIAGGLIYTSLEFRKGREARHVANFTHLVELQMQLRRMRVEDPSLAEVYKHDVQGLRTDREVREYFFNLMQLSVFEIVWFSYRARQLPADYYQSWDKRMREIAREESFRTMMEGPNMKILHDDFQTYVQQMVKEERALERASQRAIDRANAERTNDRASA
jgi:hypothetical protein